MMQAEKIWNAGYGHWTRASSLPGGERGQKCSAALWELLSVLDYMPRGSIVKRKEGETTQRWNYGKRAKRRRLHRCGGAFADGMFRLFIVSGK
jgi:hypothetical protein